MNTIEVVVLLFVAVAALAWGAARLRVPYPIFLVLGGLALSLIPGLPRVELSPDVVFFLVLPPILYQAGLMTSWRDFKANARPIALLAFGLVLFTTAIVAALAHFVMGMSWAAGFVLGAIVSPPDAVAATAIMSRMRLPRRIITILEGESLVNDATALVALRFAIAAVVTGQFSMVEASWKLGWVALGGTAIGLAVGWIISWVRARLQSEDGVDTLVSLLTPYIAYLPAEHLGVSGVLAAVAAGVYMSRSIPRITTSRTRLRLYGVWDVWVYLLNGLVFILIGLQLPLVVARLRDHLGAPLIGWALLLSLGVMLIRLVWVYPAALLSRNVRGHEGPPNHRNVLMVAWTGMRGIVSLAAAMALPMTLADQQTSFPHRDLIIFLTFGVILFTLVVQGLSLPLVIKILKLGEDGLADREELQARYEGVHAALSRIEALVFLGEAREETVSRVREEYQALARYLHQRLKGGLDGEEEKCFTCTTADAVLREAITAQRQMVIKLRDDAVISDEVLRRIQSELDLEEARVGESESV